MQGSTYDHVVVYLGSKIFGTGQAYLALNRIKSLEGLLIEKLYCIKLTGNRTSNNYALNKMNRLKNISSENYKVKNKLLVKAFYKTSHNLDVLKKKLNYKLNQTYRFVTINSLMI